MAVKMGEKLERSVKTSNLAAVLESRLVRRSAATPPRGAFCGCDDLSGFEQPVRNLFKERFWEWVN